MNGELHADDVALLRTIAESDELARIAAANGLTLSDLDPTTVDGWLGEQYDREHHTWLRRALNRVRAAGYVRRLKGSGYALTPAGRHAVGIETGAPGSKTKPLATSVTGGGT
jgi:hypothetical protein